MDVLLVEDDEFKAADIVRVLDDFLREAAVTRAASVTSALRSLTQCAFDLVILDMSLPTFDLSGPGGGGSPQGQGGIEVLRLARRLNRGSNFVIVTQYPDIEIDGIEVPLASAAQVLCGRFGLNIWACVPYQFDRDDWRAALKAVLPRVEIPSSEGK